VVGVQRFQRFQLYYAVEVEKLEEDHDVLRERQKIGLVVEVLTMVVVLKLNH
jgi:hypothetical protein